MKAGPSISIRPFGITSDEDETMLFTLKNSCGMEVSITDFGGIVTTVLVVNKDGSKTDVVLGYDNVEAYIENSPYFGAIVGRYGNRIGRAGFDIDGVHYELTPTTPAGANPVQLHGGLVGFDKKVWKAKPFINNGEASLSLRCESADGEEGFPGKLEVEVLYTLTEQNELRIDYAAKTDKTTHVNLTNHSYFNLKGEGEGDILDHLVEIDSSFITLVDTDLIPTGELMDVVGTPFDLNDPVVIGEKIGISHEQLALGGGFDHNFVLKTSAGNAAVVAKVVEPKSGRFLEVITEEPGVQFYTGNSLDGSCVGKSGKPYEKQSGFCLETQHYPDTPNQPNFPTTLLRPGETYSTTTIYRFGQE